MTPYYCIIITSYNNEDEVLNCLKSCLSQSFKDFYILIVDDGSTDNTVERIKKINSSKIKLVVNKKNLGASCSRHLAIKKAKAKWIISLDGDWRLYNKYTLKNLKKKIIQNSNLDINYFGAKIKFDQGPVSPLINNDIVLNYIGRVRMLNTDQYDFLKIFKKKIYKKYCYWPQNQRFADGLIGLNWHKKNDIKFLNLVSVFQSTSSKKSLSRLSDYKYSLFFNKITKNAEHRIWEYQKILKLHKNVIHKYAPNYYRNLFYVLGLNYFFINNKKKGAYYVIKAIYLKFYDIKKWVVLLLGILNRKLLILLYKQHLKISNR